MFVLLDLRYIRSCRSLSVILDFLSLPVFGLFFSTCLFDVVIVLLGQYLLELFTERLPPTPPREINHF